MTMHFWTPEMADRRGGPYSERYYNLCGDNDDENYIDNESEVTCERCLAALRSRSGAASPGCEGAPSSAPSPTPEFAPSKPAPVPDADTVAVLKSYSRLAVLAERERCVKAMAAFFGGSEKAFPLIFELAKAIREGAE